MGTLSRLRDFTADRDATPPIAISAQGIDDELDQVITESNAQDVRLDTLEAGGNVSTADLADDAVTPAKTSFVDDTLAATDTHIMVADGTDFGNVAVSGDATLANTGALTIASNAITESKIANGAITTDKLSADCVVAAKVADDSLMNADINSSAAIAATKIHDGTISNTEFGYLNGVTSNIQTQLNTETLKVSSDDTTKGYLNGKLVGGTGITLTENSGGGNETLTLSTSGSPIAWTLTTKANSDSPVSVGTSNNNTIFCANTSGGNITFNLGAAATLGSAFMIGIKKTHASNTVTIDGNGSETIDGDTTVTLTANKEYTQIICDGSNWFVVSEDLDDVLDSSLRISDQADQTKKLGFEVSGISTGTTRTLTMANQDVDLTPTTGTYATECFKSITDGSNIIAADSVRDTLTITGTGGTSVVNSPGTDTITINSTAGASVGLVLALG
jgi:hypothetical protein